MGIFDFFKIKKDIDIEKICNDFKNMCIKLNIDFGKNGKFDFFNEGDLIIREHEKGKTDKEIISSIDENPIVGLIYHTIDSFLKTRFELFIDFFHENRKGIINEEDDLYDYYPGSEEISIKNLIILIYFYWHWQNKVEIKKDKYDKNIKKITEILGY